MKITENIWLIIFILWGLPLSYYRSNFRKIVYRTTDWKINIKPRFGKEIKALFGNMYPYDSGYLRARNFYRIYLIIFTALFITTKISTAKSENNYSENMKKIEIGDKIPEFILQDQNGNDFDIKSIFGKKNLVLFFYPKDDTPGCTKQACAFRDYYEAFADINAEVIGISGQSVESHKKFAENYSLSYKILSDKGNNVRKAFGVPTNLFGLLPGRVTYVIDKSGKVIHTFNSQSNISGHVNEALNILNKLN